uniref:Uncharacterized protein n=1 Tax=Hucho hucho TaxID=62062 RepID=A0A4W5QGU3_9TELE
MFKAVMKKNRDGGKGSKKEPAGDLHSAQRRCPPCGGASQIHEPGSLHHPYVPEDVFRLSLSKGVSMSLPSSPLLPRQSYVMPLRSSKRSPAELQAEKEPSSSSSPATQELMTRLGFLLGEGIPGTARIPMEDKNEKKVFHFPGSCCSSRTTPEIER